MDIRAERLAAGMSQSQLARAAKVSQPNISAYENGRREPSPEVLERLRHALNAPPMHRIDQHRADIHRLVSEHRAAAPRIFGSVARGDNTAGSDLDLLVDFTPDASLLDIIGLRLDLVDLLHIDVDVVDVDSLRGEMRERILKEAVAI
ncbi:helix-turn-helix domain-containing protein [Citricoccus sp. NR2]|uniref:helix-turn-helix domain-containing protein n=1 Tax=Citricoccus sp. NR2 TaxID=3004095 RepID=UPI0022DE48A7|nr:helix-turn-helix domain-containing protein [Citricoccus sp. NR2]WBL19934.1 helix-turn-helix domain-containing protein [Citricoccus sp. NR2]